MGGKDGIISPGEAPARAARSPAPPAPGTLEDRTHRTSDVEPHTSDLDGPARLQRILSRAGVASRRHAEELIAAGRVRVNGQVVRQLGTRADPERDAITVDGVPVRQPDEATYLALHKPPGYLTTADDPQGRPTVFDLLPPVPGLFPVGRLDRDSEGLLLLTTDGEWAQHILHPRYGCTKEYLAEVEGRPAPGALARLRQPLDLGGGESSSGAEVRLTDALPGRSLLRIVIGEGRNRQIRRMCEAVGHPVRQLVRLRVGAVHLGDLRAGEWRRLTWDEISRTAGAAPPASDSPGRPPAPRARSAARRSA
jgi:23S rRNA pseudouridine2605 synthase